MHSDSPGTDNSQTSESDRCQSVPSIELNKREEPRGLEVSLVVVPVEGPCSCIAVPHARVFGPSPWRRLTSFGA